MRRFGDRLTGEALRRRRDAARERLEAAVEVANTLTSDTDDDTAASVNAELNAAEVAYDRAMIALDAWLNDTGPERGE